MKNLAYALTAASSRLPGDRPCGPKVTYVYDKELGKEIGLSAPKN